MERSFPQLHRSIRIAGRCGFASSCQQDQTAVRPDSKCLVNAGFRQTGRRLFQKAQFCQVDVALTLQRTKAERPFRVSQSTVQMSAIFAHHQRQPSVLLFA